MLQNLDNVFFCFETLLRVRQMLQLNSDYLEPKGVFGEFDNKVWPLHLGLLVK